MKKIVLSGLCLRRPRGPAPRVPVHAHGGQYRGPGDVVPPSPGGGGGTGGPAGPTTGGPAGPERAGPSGPTTGGPAGPRRVALPARPAQKRGAPPAGRGVDIEDDLTTWNYWWEFNKDPFIRLKDAVAERWPADR
jgi:hypothetical protein